MDSNEIVFFGKVDHNKEGHISSEIPAWAMDSHLEDLRESVAQKERQLKSGTNMPSELPLLQENFRKETQKLEAIESSRPQLSEAQKDKCYKAYKDLSSKIADMMPTYDEDRKGLADPHKEAKKMVQPFIEVDPELAKACGVANIKDGKVSRNAASRMYKILGHYFGENTNTEALRRESRGGKK